MEDCDDANGSNLDACTNSCKMPSCSDGIRSGAELGVDCGGPCPKACIVINEVDYDQPGMVDAAEFIEILNVSAGPVDLAGHLVVLVNGANNPPTVYRTYDLAPSGTLGVGEYLVIAPMAFNVNGAKHVVAPATDAIQNGGASPDGLAIFHLPTTTIVDALSYEGSVAPFTIMMMFGPYNLVEGNPTPIADLNVGVLSLVRLPNGSDTNDAATDWALSTMPSPGLANVP
jgi:hypothetical protein